LGDKQTYHKQMSPAERRLTQREETAISIAISARLNAFKRAFSGKCAEGMQKIIDEERETELQPFHGARRKKGETVGLSKGHDRMKTLLEGGAEITT